MPQSHARSSFRPHQNIRTEGILRIPLLLGFNPSFRSAKVGQESSIKYALAYGYPEVFRVKYRVSGEERSMEVMLQAASKAEVDEAKPIRKELSLKEMEDEKTALLTINTFIYYDQVDMFRSFMDSVFQVIDQKQISKLVLDLRATYTCTGNATYPSLKHSRIMVGTARVMRYTAAVKNMDPRRGVIPDYPVELSQLDIIRGKDPVLKHALQLAGSH